VLAVLAGLAVTFAQGSEGDEERVVRYANDHLTVRLARAPVGEVLDEIGRVSGAEIRGQPNPREVSAEFEDVRLPDGLQRLLGNQSFMLKYGEKDRLVAIDLLGGSMTAPPAVSPAGARPTTAQARLLSLQEAWRRHPLVPLTGALATALGTNAASVDQLVNTALHNDDAGVRQEALRTALNVVESDATLRDGLRATISTVDDAALGASLRGIAGDRAEELVAYVMTQAPAGDLRMKAVSVLKQLRAQAGAAHPGT